MKLDRLLAVTTVGVLLLAGSASAAVWKVPGDFPTIQAAIDSSRVVDGDTIHVRRGRRTGATVTKAVTIRSQGASIVDGPVVNSFDKAGFLFPGGGKGSGATIMGFRFANVAFPVFSRGADDVSVTMNTLLSPNQGVTNWANGSWGNAWDITHNTILDLRTNNGGGIGILIGDYLGGTVTGNVIAHNEIRGTVRVPASDGGGYNDGPWGPLSFPHAGIELSDTRDLASELVISSNALTFNDLRGMDVPFAFTPDELETVNFFAHNHTGDAPSWQNLALRAASPSGAEAAPVR